MDHGGAGAVGDVSLDRRLQSNHHPSGAGLQLHQSDHGGFRRDLADAGDRRHRIRGYRRRKERVGGVLLLHLTAHAVVGPERDRVHQVGRGRIRQASCDDVADTRDDPAGLVLLLDSLFLFQHHLARGGGVAGGARRRHQHSRIVDPDADAALRLLAGIDGRDLALCNRSGADVFRQRLYRQSRFLEIRPDLRTDLLCRPSRDRAALAASDRVGRPVSPLRHKIAKTTPCKVEWAPARSARAACVRGTRRKMVRRHGPNLISCRSGARVRPVVCFHLRRGARSAPSAARAAIWNAASMPRISVPLSGASNRIARPAWFGAAVTPARHPHASTAASISAISATWSGGAIMRTEPAAAIPPSAPQPAASSSPPTLPRSETSGVPSGPMMLVWVENCANVPPRPCGSWAAKPSAMIRVAPAATVAVVATWRSAPGNRT